MMKVLFISLSMIINLEGKKDAEIRKTMPGVRFDS